MNWYRIISKINLLVLNRFRGRVLHKAYAKLYLKETIQMKKEYEIVIRNGKEYVKIFTKRLRGKLLPNNKSVPLFIPKDKYDPNYKSKFK